MIEQRGVVVELDGDHAWVRVGGQSGCPACDEGRGCGAGLFGRLLKRSDTRVRVENRLQAGLGQSVALGLRESDFLGLVLRLYGWPLLAGLLGMLLAHEALESTIGPRALDLAAGSGALLAGGATLFWTRARLAGRFTRLSPAMVKATGRLDCASVDRTQ